MKEDINESTGDKINRPPGEGIKTKNQISIERKKNNLIRRKEGRRP